MTTKSKSGRKRVWRIFRQCGPGLLLSYLVSVALVLLTLAQPLYLMQIFTRAVPSRSGSSLFWLTLIVIASLIFLGLLSYLRNRLHQRLGQWLERRFLLEGLEPLVARSLQSQGDPVTIFEDVKRLRRFVSSDQIPLAMEVSLSPIFLLFLYLLHPLFAMVALAFIGLLVVLVYVNELLSADSLVTLGDSEGRIRRDLSGIIRNAEVLEAMGMFGALLTRWWGGNSKTQRHQLLLARRSAVLLAVAQSMTLIASVVTLAIAGLLVIEEKTGLVNLLVAMLVAMMLLAPLQRIIAGWPLWVEARHAARQIADLLRKTDASRSHTQLPAPEGPLEVERLIFVPPGGSKPALRGINFQAAPGDAIAVVGPSASGKSTLARMLVGLWRPTAGAVHLDGHDVYTWDRDNFGRYIGYLPQRVGLFTGTIKENISRMQDCDPREVVEAARLAGVHDVIGRMKLGYDTVISDDCYELTGGQRQLIGLARAMFRRPRLLVLDEPDSNLDGEGVAALGRAIRQFRVDGAIVVVVTHRSELLDAVDKVLALRDGSLQAFAPVRQWRDSSRVVQKLPGQAKRLSAPNGRKQERPAPSSQTAAPADPDPATGPAPAQPPTPAPTPAGEAVSGANDPATGEPKAETARVAGKGSRG